MIECGISPRDILVVIGGSEENYDNFKFCGLYNYLNVKYNAIDQNCFYAIKQNPSIFDQEYYYYMHDTTKVGPKFKTSTESLFNFAQSHNLNTMKNTSQCYCGNMGFYKKSFIIKTLSEFDIYTKNESLFVEEDDSSNPKKLINKKNIGFDLEDKIFLYDQQISNGLYYVISNNSPTVEQQKQDIYGSGNERIVTYYQELDFYKFGGNGANSNLGCRI